MATPQGDLYGCASGGVIAAGFYRRAAWRRAQGINTWSEIPTTLLSSIDPKDSLTHNPNYPATAPWLRTTGGTGLTNKQTNDGVMTAYCGGAFDDVTGTFWLPLGGGHSDYGGNESYKIPLNVDSPAWSMVRPPSGSSTLIAGGLPAGSTALANSYVLDDGLESSGVYADGRPRATHSYSRHVHVPGVGVVMPFHGGGFTNPNNATSKNTIHLPEDSTEWIFHPIGSQMPYMGGASGSSGCLDSTRGVVLFLGAGTGARLYRCDVSTWNWSEVGPGSNLATGDVSITYIKEYDIVFEVCDYFSTKFCIRDASTGVITSPSVTGTPQSIDGASGAAWVPNIGMVFNVGKSLYALTPTGNPKTDPWSWSLISASNPELPTDTGSGYTSGGMYSKFGYSKKLGGLYRFTDATHRPWFYATE